MFLRNTLKSSQSFLSVSRGLVSSRVFQNSIKVTTPLSWPLKRDQFSTMSEPVPTNNKRALEDASLPEKPAKKTPSEIIQKHAFLNSDTKPIIWIDCEMTGLDFMNDHIIEICCLITDKDLNLLDEEGYESVIHYSKEVMDGMNEWCVNQHGKSGLTQKVIESEKTLKQVESELYTYIAQYTNKGVGILAGNSVHMDRLFMLREMPKVVDYMTYRIIDVSSIMEVARRHNPKVNSLFPRKKECHTARSDIIESINQLRYYRDNYLKSEAELDEEKIKASLGSKSESTSFDETKDKVDSENAADSKSEQ